MVVRLMFLIIHIYTDVYRCFQSRGGGEASNKDSVFQSVRTSLGSLIANFSLHASLYGMFLILGNVLCVELMESTWNDHFNCSNIT